MTSPKPGWASQSFLFPSDVVVQLAGRTARIAEHLTDLLRAIKDLPLPTETAMRALEYVVKTADENAVIQAIVRICVEETPDCAEKPWTKEN